MTTHTLKILIDIEFNRSEDILKFKNEVFRLIDLYEIDNSYPTQYLSPVLNIQTEPEEIPYSEICPCNPKNGGSGICGCDIGNKMVANPKSNWCTTATNSNFNLKNINIQNS